MLYPAELRVHRAKAKDFRAFGDNRPCPARQSSRNEAATCGTSRHNLVTFTVTPVREHWAL
jgi:hypothetical protein